MELYLDRCKHRHALAFLQFRRILPKAKLHDLMEIFQDRKKYQTKLHAKMQELIDNGYSHPGSQPYKPVEVKDVDRRAIANKMIKRGFSEGCNTEAKFIERNGGIWKPSGLMQLGMKL